MCGVCTEEVSWSASFSGFDAGDLIAARPVRYDFCFHIRQSPALQPNAPVHTESVNPPAGERESAGALHAVCRFHAKNGLHAHGAALDSCRIRHAVRARLWCCSEYQTGAYSSSSSNDSKNASATILNCESSDFSPPLRGRAFPSNGHETMLLPSRCLGSLSCGD
jgi:hypothetical protein